MADHIIDPVAFLDGLISNSDHFDQLAKDCWKRVRAQVPEGHICRTSLLREMNDDLLTILGKPNFTCGPIAHLMKMAGVVDIPPKAEAEQAHVLLWLLRHYLDHGLAWDVAAKRDLETWHAKIHADQEQRA